MRCVHGMTETWISGASPEPESRYTQITQRARKSSPRTDDTHTAIDLRDSELIGAEIRSIANRRLELLHHVLKKQRYQFTRIAADKAEHAVDGAFNVARAVLNCRKCPALGIEIRAGELRQVEVVDAIGVRIWCARAQPFHPSPSSLPAPFELLGLVKRGGIVVRISFSPEFPKGCTDTDTCRRLSLCRLIAQVQRTALYRGPGSPMTGSPTS